MDPNETLNRLRELLDEAHGSRTLLGSEQYILELTAAMRDLDRWMSRGGYRPEGWDPLRLERQPRVQLDAQICELAAVAIIHRYRLDKEGAAQLRANLNGDLHKAARAALEGDWDGPKGVAYHTVHVRAAVQLRRAAAEAGWLDELPSSWAASVAQGEGRGGVERGDGLGEDQEAQR